MNVIIILIIIGLILKQLRYMKELIIPTRKSCMEISTVLIALSVFIYITYFYASTWTHYLIGVLLSVLYICIYIKQGIASKGFISRYKYKEVILWGEIKKVKIINSNNIKIKLSGDFMEQTFSFKKDNYHEIIGILKENLPKQAQLEEKLNK